ncbi:MAG TPA: hypothetical protein PLF11_01400 [Bacillota bacterium]|nr:hypothetical protein [Bacillota bacterium]
MKARTRTALIVIAAVAVAALLGVVFREHLPARAWPVKLALPTLSLPKPAPLMPEKVTVEVDGRWVPDEIYTPRDTLPVHVDVAISRRDTSAVVTIGEQAVLVDSVRVVIEPARLRWSVYGELASNGEPAVGAAYQPLRVIGLDIGPTLSVDASGLDWLQAGVRISRQVHTTLNAGLEVGYRFFEDDGLHAGVSFGIGL